MKHLQFSLITKKKSKWLGKKELSNKYITNKP